MKDLGRGPSHIFGLYALCGNAEHAIAHPLNFGVDWGLAWKDHQDQLKHGEVLLEVAEHWLHIRHILNVLAEVWLALDPHAKIARDAHQTLNETPESLRRNGLLRSETGDCPTLDVDPGEELLATHVPHTLARSGDGPVVVVARLVLHLGRVEHPGRRVQHGLRHLESKLSDERVVVEVGLVDQVLDLSLRIPERPVGIVEGFSSGVSGCNQTLSMKT